MEKKLKTYVIFVSRTYPAYHSKKGQLTHFIDRIIYGIKYHNTNYHPNFHWGNDKIHTFRGNYQLWKKRVDEVLDGKAVIVLKYHSLGRYVKGNKQIEFVRLDKNSGVGVQKAELNFKTLVSRIDEDAFNQNIDQLGRNDGLEWEDFREWFLKGKYDLREPLACIQFTSFRYGTLPSPK